MTDLSNIIRVGYDARTRKLTMQFPFHLADIARGYPSKRFDPKTKLWRIPLSRSNVTHFNQSRDRFDYRLTDEARQALQDFDTIIAPPVRVPFPYHVYDFKRSATGHVPMTHQRRMLDAAWGLKVNAWFAKMGTGKTFAAIHLACARYLAGLIDAVVVVCPSTLRSTWSKEFAKYATVAYDYRIHVTRSKEQDRFYADKSREKMQVLAVSVEGLGISSTLYDSVCGFFPGRRVMVVCDESSRIKNPSSNRTQRAIQFREASEYRIILNGTPIALGIQDLYSQFEFLDSNIIGMDDFWSFRSRYLVMGGFENKKIVGVQNVEELMRLIEPYCVEVGKDVLDLPPKVVVTRSCEATPEQKKLLKLVKNGSNGDPNAPYIKVDNSLERILRYRQIVGGWVPKSDPLTGTVELVPLKHNPKMDLLMDIIEDAFPASKFIIWTPFVHEIRHISALLAEKYGAESVAEYRGDVDKDTRSQIEDRYCRDTSLRFFVANPATAGLGLTLISGMDDIMIYYSGTTAYIDRAQSEDRSHRIGQTRSVTVVDLVVDNTVDGLIIEANRAKMDVETYIYSRLRDGAPEIDMCG